MLHRAGFEMVEWTVVPRSFHLSYIAHRAGPSHGRLAQLAGVKSMGDDPKLPRRLGDIVRWWPDPASPEPGEPGLRPLGRGEGAHLVADPAGEGRRTLDSWQSPSLTWLCRRSGTTPPSAVGTPNTTREWVRSAQRSEGAVVLGPHHRPLAEAGDLLFHLDAADEAGDAGLHIGDGGGPPAGLFGVHTRRR